MAEAVKVAVRVRPFNSRESARGAKLIIDMNGNTTTIADPADPDKEPRPFTFDYSYWSHNGGVEQEDGEWLADSAVPDNRYADQRCVFNDLGIGMLDNAWNGYNCSLFAYGQTGSGKSYSVMGYGSNKGIMPQLCNELFEGIKRKGIDCQVSVSMLEIYNECVHDLLSTAKRHKGGMKVRNHPKKGFFVDGLVVMPVIDFTSIEATIDKGTKNRTVAATQMNATSSRAHTIVTIMFSQKALDASGTSMTKTAVINLVDLAGSERAESTGATGDRLKEGSAINQSLSSLGNVISALADAAEGKKKKVMIPFRNSVLTMLLKNALSGNSKTIMCAALSPADINYEETLSTLRFADRAKAIKTKAVVNESPTEKLIRELREENARLMAMMAGKALTGEALPPMPGSPPPAGQAPDGSAQMGSPGGTGAVSAEEQERAHKEKERMEREHKEAEELLKEQLERNQKEMEAMQLSYEARMQEQQAQQAAEEEAAKAKAEVHKTLCHFWNLNVDSTLEGAVVHYIKKDATIKVGNTKADPPPEIVCGGMGMLKEHATVRNEGSKVYLQKASPNAKVVRNGKDIGDDPMELHHHDRILFGNNHLFCVEHPRERDAGADSGVKFIKPTFEDAQLEIAEQQGITTQNIASAGGSQEGGLDKSGLQEELVTIMPHVNEANAISQELDKKRFFEVVLTNPDLDQASGASKARVVCRVKVHDFFRGVSWMWSKTTFLNRKYMMQEMYQNYIDDDQDWDLPQDKDPFWEPIQHQVIGSAFLYLESLAYLVDISEHLPINDAKGIEAGHIFATIDLADRKGKKLSDEEAEDSFLEDPIELLGRRADFMLTVESVKGLAKDETGDVYVTYHFMDQPPVETNSISGTINPEFNFQSHLAIPKVAREHLDYFEHQAIKLTVHAKKIPQDNSANAGMTTTELIADFHRGNGVQAGSEESGKKLRRKSSAALAMQEAFAPSPLHFEETDDHKEEQIRDHNRQVNAMEQKFHREVRRAQRLAAKLKRIEALVKEHTKQGSEAVSIKALQHALHPARTQRFKSVVKVIMMSLRMEKMRKAMVVEREAQKQSSTRASQSSLARGPKGSKACSIQ